MAEPRDGPLKGELAAIQFRSSGAQASRLSDGRAMTSPLRRVPWGLDRDDCDPGRLRPERLA